MRQWHRYSLRVSYALSAQSFRYRLPGGDRATKKVPSRDEREADDMHLTRAEFAEALGMREDDLFIR